MPAWWARLGREPVALGTSMLGVLRSLGEPDSIYPTPEAYDPSIDDTYYFRYPDRGVDVEIDHGNRVVCLHFRAHGLEHAGVPTTRSAVEAMVGPPALSGEHTVRRRRVAWAQYARPRAGVATIEYDRTGRVLRVSRGEKG